MKKENCRISNSALCAMAAGVLGLFGLSALFTAAAVRTKKSECPSADCLPEAEQQRA